MNGTPEQQHRLAVLRGRIGAYGLQAMYDSRELTRSARQAFDARFEREVDPNHELADAERLRRAAAARRAYFAQLAYKSALKRVKRV